MISSIEFLFVAFDYLSFLLEPLLQRLFVKLDWLSGSRLRKDVGEGSCQGSWRRSSCKRSAEERLLSQLEVEMEDLYASNKTRLSSSRDKRFESLSEIKRMIGVKWPWLESIHLARIDQVDEQLDWQDYDICLVADDWDLPSLAPSLHSPLGALTTTAAAARISTTSTSTSTPTTMTTTTKTDDAPIATTTKAAATATSGAANVAALGDRDAEAQMRIIYSSPVDRKVFLQFMSSSDGEEVGYEEALGGWQAESAAVSGNVDVDGENRQRDDERFGDEQTTSSTATSNNHLKTTDQHCSTTTTRVAEEEEKKSILCVKWITIEQFSLLQARAKLLFLYTQLHPELTRLYLLVASLLECAHLIELSSSSSAAAFAAAAASAATAVPTQPGAHLSQRPKLSRYALVLMLVAHLQTAKPTTTNTSTSRPRKDKDSTDDNHIGKHEIYLARRFIEFLTIYSNTNGCRLLVRPTLRQKTQLELLLVADGDDGKTVGCGELVVLDPILTSSSSPSSVCKTSEAASRLIGCVPNSEQQWSTNEQQRWSQLTNLTDNVQMAPIRLLFGRLEAHLKAVECGKHLDDRQSHCRRPLLSGLFALCKRTSLSNQQQLSNTSTDLGGSSSAPDQQYSNQRLHPHRETSTSTSLNTGSHYPLLTLKSQRSMGSLLRRRASLSARRLLLNLLYLALFLLIRNQLLSYLVRLRSDLKEQAREDMVQLKYTLLSPNPIDQLRLNLDLQTTEQAPEQVSQGRGSTTDQHSADADGGNLDFALPPLNNQDTANAADDAANNNNKLLAQELWSSLAQVMVMQALGGSGKEFEGTAGGEQSLDFSQLMYLLREQLERNSGDDDDLEGENAELLELAALLEGLGGFSEGDVGSNAGEDQPANEESQRDERPVGEEL